MICRYCGKTGGKSSKEHVIPVALGGRLKIKQVCETCNNEILSDLDKELCSKSPLSIVSLMATGKNSHSEFWLKDHTLNGTYVEANYQHATDSPITCPQALFSNQKVQFRFDFSTIEKYGLSIDQLPNLLMNNAKKALYLKDKKEDKSALPILRKHESLIDNPESFPPRIHVGDLKKVIERRPKVTLTCLDKTQERIACDIIHNWPVLGKSITTQSYHMPRETGLYLMFCPSILSRSLVKISFNMLAHYCKLTGVDFRNFPETVHYILGNLDNHSGKIKAYFVEENYKGDIRDAPAIHEVDIQHFNRNWTFLWSFFGGAVEAFVSFPGENKDLWERKKITIPIDSSKWVNENYQIVQPIRTQKLKYWNQLFSGTAFYNTRHIETKGTRKIPRIKNLTA